MIKTYHTINEFDTNQLSKTESEKILEYSLPYYLVDVDDRDVFTKLLDSIYLLSNTELKDEKDLCNILNDISINYETSFKESMTILNQTIELYYHKVQEFNKKQY